MSRITIAWLAVIAAVMAVILAIYTMCPAPPLVKEPVNTKPKLSTYKIIQGTWTDDGSDIIYMIQGHDVVRDGGCVKVIELVDYLKLPKTNGIICGQQLDVIIEK